MRLIIASLASGLFLTACGSAEVQTPAVSSDTKLKLTQVVAEAEFPWGMVFLPNGDLLFTEKEGGLKRVAGGEGTPVAVSGMPEAYTERQAGYLGLAVDPDFGTNRLVYVAYSKGNAADNMTAIIQARLSDDGSALENVTEIFAADTRNTALHYGARLQFAADGTLYATLGDGFAFMDLAQDRTARSSASMPMAAFLRTTRLRMARLAIRRSGPMATATRRASIMMPTRTRSIQPNMAPRVVTS